MPCATFIRQTLLLRRLLLAFTVAAVSAPAFAALVGTLGASIDSTGAGLSADAGGNSNSVDLHSPSIGTRVMSQAPLFSTRANGSPIVPTYRVLSSPKTRVNTFSFVDDTGVTVLKVQSSDAAGTVALPFDVNPPETPLLQWRWKVSHALEHADFSKKMSDDHAVRVYVFFDVPLETLSFGDRTKLRLARAVLGNEVPTAAICYVWDNRLSIGHIGSSPFTYRVQKIVLRSGNAEAGTWRSETRNVAADYRAAFGHAATAPVPRIIGVAVGSDTDQTNDAVTAWFGDVWFSGK
jgi:hypothetical protein